MKRQPTEWEKIYAKYLSDKQLISKIHKQLIQFNNKKPQAIQVKSGQRMWIDIFLKKTYKGQPTHKNVLNMTNHQEMQNETTVSITSSLWEWLLSKRQEITSIVKDVEKREPFLVEMYIGAATMKNSLEVPQKKKGNEILPSATTWTDLEDTVPSEVSPTEEDKCHMISRKCGV